MSGFASEGTAKVSATVECIKAGALARACSWHGGFMSKADEILADQGAMISHTICPSCLASHFPELAEAAA